MLRQAEDMPVLGGVAETFYRYGLTVQGDVGVDRFCVTGVEFCGRRQQVSWVLDV